MNVYFVIGVQLLYSLDFITMKFIIFFISLSKAFLNHFEYLVPLSVKVGRRTQNGTVILYTLLFSKRFFFK